MRLQASGGGQRGPSAGERKQDPSSQKHTFKDTPDSSGREAQTLTETHTRTSSRTWRGARESAQRFEAFQTTEDRGKERTREEGEKRKPLEFSLTVIISTLRDGSGGVQRRRRWRRRKRRAKPKGGCCCRGPAVSCLTPHTHITPP